MTGKTGRAAKTAAQAIVLIGAALAMPPDAGAHQDGTQAPAPAARCEVAVVSPVSGYAECVKPRGVPVDPPPKRPVPTPDECRAHPDAAPGACPQSPPDQGH